MLLFEVSRFKSHRTGLEITDFLVLPYCHCTVPPVRGRIKIFIHMRLKKIFAQRKSLLEDRDFFYLNFSESFLSGSYLFSENKSHLH